MARRAFWILVLMQFIYIVVIFILLTVFAVRTSNTLVLLLLRLSTSTLARVELFLPMRNLDYEDWFVKMLYFDDTFGMLLDATILSHLVMLTNITWWCCYCSHSAMLLVIAMCCCYFCDVTWGHLFHWELLLMFFRAIFGARGGYVSGALIPLIDLLSEYVFCLLPFLFPFFFLFHFQHFAGNFAHTSHFCLVMTLNPRCTICQVLIIFFADKKKENG